MNNNLRPFSVFSVCAVAIAGFALSAANVHAGAKTWSSATGGNVSTGSNWGGSAPLSGDSLIFSNAGGGTVVFDTATYGGSAGAAGNLLGISFTGTPGAYTLDLSANSFNLANPNAITIASTVTNNQTVGTSAGSGTIFISAAASAGTGFFVNSSTNATLVINSNITKGDSGVSNSSIVFGNISSGVPTGTGNITVNGNITTMGNGVSKTGSGTLTFAGTNSYSGATTINSGTLNLTGSIGNSTAITVTQAQSIAVGTGANTASSTGGIFTQSTSGSITGTATLIVASSQAIGGTAGTANLAGNNTSTGAITVGSVSFNTASPYTIASLSGATLTLSGSNNSAVNQTITVNPNSRLVLDFSASGAPTNNILNNVSNATNVNLTGAQLEIIGKSGATNSQTLSTNATANGVVPIANTASQVKLTQNGATSLSLDLKSINRGGSATIDIVFPTTGTVSSTNSQTNGLASSGGLAWGTANNGTTLLGASGTALSAYAGWQTGVGNYTTTKNVDVTNGDSVSGVTVGTMRFNGSNVTLTNAGNSSLSGGTILVTPGSTASISGGTFKSTAGNETFIINNGNLSFGSTITTNNAADKVTVISTYGQSGNATFTANNTIGTGGLFVNNTSATFTGNNTINGAVTVGYNGVLTLSGNNTMSSNFTWSSQGGGTLVLAGAGTLGTGALITSTSGTTNTVKFASDVQVSGGGASTASINWTGGNGAFIQNYIFDRATAGTTAVNETFSSAYLNQQGVWNLLQGSNYTTGFTLPTLTVSGATTFGSGNSNATSTINAMGANVSLGSVTPILSNGKVATLALNGSSVGNLITGVIADGGSGGTLNAAAITKSGTGTWTLQGSNTGTGATAVNGGTLVLDYGTNNNSKISSTGVLTLSGGALQLKGGSTAQSVASTTFNTGQSAITRNGGTSTIALGAITSTAGAADFTSGVATTTTINGVNGLLGGLAKYTVGGADWAVSGASGTNSITALGSYTDLAIASGGGNTTNYRLVGSNGTPVTGGLTLGTLKISTTGAGQSLALGTQSLTLGNATGNSGLLFTGADNYTITSTNATALKGSGTLILQDWGTGVLTLNASLGTNYEKYGTGKVVLGANAGASLSASIFAGTVQYSADAQLSNDSAKIITISGSYGNGAALVANTAGNLTNSRAITLGAQGGSYIDIVGGGTLTLSGIISGTQSAVANNIVTFGGASAVDTTNNAATNGTIVLSGANTYSGGTTLAGGTVNLGGAEVAGASGPFGSGGTITFTGGTLQYSASNQFDYSSRFSKVGNQSFNIDTNGQNVTYAYGLAGASSTLNKLGNGTLTLSGVSSFTGNTTVSTGTLSVTGSLSSGSALTVASGATLAGTGTIGGATTVNGVIAPGTTGFGTLSLANGVTWNAGNAWKFDLGASGTSDLINITGDFTKGTGSGFTFDFNGGNGGVAGVWTLAQWTGTTTFVSGDFSATNLGSLFGGVFSVSGTTLTFTAVPEPHEYALAFAIMLGALIAVRRRKARMA